MNNFVILCGGSGSRLWPKSREKLPKQLLALTNEFTMLQNTILRIDKIIKQINVDSKITIICNKEHSFLIEKQFNELQLSIQFTIISEPKGRDSAPAICIASLIGSENDTTIVVPCDHIFDDDAFAKCVIRALNKENAYLENSIVTFGIKPTRIETGYGYIQVDNNNHTEKFVEKPDYETAKSYFEEGIYLWNAGIFIFKNKNMIQCFKNYAPDILDNCMSTMKNSVSSDVLQEPFTSCRAISIDYAIMEELCNDPMSNISALTLPYTSKWSDIGSFESLYEELNNMADKNGNVITSNTDVIMIESHNNYIESDGPLISIVGLNNIIIVNTRDALLVCNKDRSQDVKKVVDVLKKENMEERVIHAKAFRPWGWYVNIEGNDLSGFKVKRIAVYPGKRLSLQSHNKRSEHWVVVKGTGLVQVGHDFLTLHANQHVYIPTGALHRIENIGDGLLEFTETQIGNYLGEDDIVRYEDDFGRL